MSENDYSKVLFKKRMCEYNNSEQKSKKLKKESEEVDLNQMSENDYPKVPFKKRMCEYKNSEQKSKKLKKECEEVDLNQKKVYTYEYYYESLFRKNKICKETNEKQSKENKTINYLRSKKTTKPIKHWFLTKGEVKHTNVKHSETIMKNIIDYKEAKIKNLENHPVNNKIVPQEKIVKSNENNSDYQKYKLTEKQKQYKIIFPNLNEQDETFPLFFSTFLYEKNLYKMKAAKLLKIKQQAKKKICPKCFKIFSADYLKRHTYKHEGKFYYTKCNISSLQMTQLMQIKSCFEFYDFDTLSNLDQIERNKQIKHFAQVANQNKKILCFLSRFQKKLSLRTTRLRFWSFPKKKNNVSNEANKANFFSRHECDIKKTVQINSLFRQNDKQENPQTLYNLLKLSLSERIKLYIVVEYLQKIGTFKFVNFNVNTRHKQPYTFKKRAKRNVQHLPNCLQIKIEDFDFIFNYFDELKVINVQEHLNIRRKKRENGIFSSQYHYLDVNDIDRVSQQFHMVHQIDTIFNCVNITNHYEIMATLFNQLKKKFGANFYSISSPEAEKFYGSSLLNVQKPIMSHVLNEFVKKNDVNVDPSIIGSTNHFIKKYYVPYYIHCFKNDCSKLLRNTPFQAVNPKKSKEFCKYEKFQKKKIIQNRQEWLMLQLKFNEQYETGSNTEQVTIDTEEIKLEEEVKEEVKELSSYIPVDCSSMPILRQSKQLPNWATFMSQLKEKLSKNDTMAKIRKKEKEMPFINSHKSDEESFFDFSLRCYQLLEKVELTEDNKINDDLISERIFQKIFNHTLKTTDHMSKFDMYFKQSPSNVITACIKFDNYLKDINCDHLVTIE